MTFNPFFPFFNGQMGQMGQTGGGNTAQPVRVNQNQTQTQNQGGSKEVLCWKFNDAKGCAVAPAGQACNKNGRVFQHRCNKESNGIVCK